MRIKSDRTSKREKFNHVDPTLAGLDTRDPRLVLPHSFGEIALPQLGGLSLSNQQLDQCSVMLRADSLHHSK